MKSILLLSSLFLCSIAPSQAGQEGGGGVSVHCTSEQKHLSIEILDHLEARVLYYLKANLGADQLALADKLELAFKRIERLNPIRANRYRKAIAGWALAKADFQEEEMPLLNDTIPSIIPENCTLVQVAIRGRPNDYGDRSAELHIQKKIWKQLSTTEQAILILHELIYWETEIAGPTIGSLSARQFNALIFSGEIEKMSPEKYLSVTRLYNLPDVEYRNLNIHPGSANFYSNGDFKSVQTGVFNPKTKWEILGTLTIQNKQLTVYNKANFREDGSIISTVLSPKVTVEDQETFLSPAELETIVGKFFVSGIITFDQDGIVTSFLDSSRPGVMSVGDNKIVCDISPEGRTAALHTSVHKVSVCWVKQGTYINLPETRFTTANDGYLFFKNDRFEWGPHLEGYGEYPKATLTGEFSVKTLNGNLFLSEVRSVGETWVGRLIEPTTIRVQSSSILVHDQITFSKFYENQIWVAEANPVKDFKYFDMVISHSNLCPAGNPTPQQAVIKMYYRGYLERNLLSEFVLASPYRWQSSYGRRGDRMKASYNYFITDNVSPSTREFPCSPN